MSESTKDFRAEELIVMKKVLFACVHNAGRSQMAAALFNRYVHPKKVAAVSAGTEPTTRVHAEVLEAKKELGIELSAAKPQFMIERTNEEVEWRGRRDGTGDDRGRGEPRRARARQARGSVRGVVALPPIARRSH
jgi:predicted protein tyrosine phosphatase